MQSNSNLQPTANPPRRNRRLHLLFALCLLSLAPIARAEVCVTQSQMKPAERDALAAAARSLAVIVQANDANALRQQTLPEYAKDFSGMASLVTSTSPHLKGAVLAVEQVYLLDASTIKVNIDGTNQDAQFFCSLNKSIAEANFLIPALPPGRYGFAMVSATGIKAPWRISFLLKQNPDPSVPSGGSWSMAGIYPKPLTAAGHDGIWYWTQARDLVKAKQQWTAYFYYLQAQSLLQPAGFVTSTHLDKLHKEATTAAPPSLSDGISADTPLVIKGPNATEFRFTDLSTDDTFNADKIDIVAHLAPDPTPDPAEPPKPGAKPAAKPAAPLSPRDRNLAAMSALLAAYPDLRANFHGIWIFADAAGKNPFVTEEAMTAIQPAAH